MTEEMIDAEYERRVEQSCVAAVEKALREFKPRIRRYPKKEKEHGN